MSNLTAVVAILVLSTVLAASAIPLSKENHFRFNRSPHRGSNRFRFNGQKRDTSKFYTTRFGKRAPSLSSVLSDTAEEAIATIPDELGSPEVRTIMTTPLGRPPSVMPRDIQGSDETGHRVACVYAGFRTFYICDVDLYVSESGIMQVGDLI